jgi:hypothetical protein
MSGQVTVIYGAADAVFGALAGKSVRSVHKALKGVFSIPDHAQALVNRNPVPGDYPLRPGDVLEFTPTGWGTKGALDPDELEAFIRRIDSGVEKMARDGVLRPRLNDMEKDIFKVLQNKTMKGEALAKTLERAFNANFKAVLAALVRHDMLGNDPADGYFVTRAFARYLKARGGV